MSLFGAFAGFYTDLLWFQSVGFTSVFTTELFTKIGLFLVFGALMGLVVATNFIVAHRVRPAYMPMSPGQAELDRYRTAVEPYRRGVVIGGSIIIGLLSGSSAAGAWQTYLQWRNSTDFGVDDEQFGMDVSFFTFDLPWWRFILGYFFAAVVLSVIVAAVTHYLYGGLRPQSAGDKTTSAARAHLSVLLGLFVLLRAVDYWLDRYGLATKDGSLIVGLQYTDVNAVLMGRTILAIISFICALLFFANVVRRTWLLPGVGVGLLVLSAVLVGGVYPAIIQRFQVRPDVPGREAPYIARNIEATRQAYGIEDVMIENYNATTTASQGQLRNDAETAASIRLLDPALLTPTYRNLQQIRAYYDFSDTLDVDRYEIRGEKRDVVGAVREVDLARVPASQRNWANDTLFYTHGFGFVAALGNTRDPDGRPSFVSSNIPPVGDLGEFQPRIYFGESSPTYSIVGAPEGAEALELDFPADDAPGGQRTFIYTGSGGVDISTAWHRLLFSVKYQEANILLTGRINDESRILFDRDPKTRVEKVAPWLSLDGDPYPSVVDGKIVWIVDGYTTTNNYPYSARTTLESTTATSLTTEQQQIVAPRDQVNYIRNSVKATVDAYDGTVTLYAWDEEDPVLQTWRKAFPGTVEDRSAIPAELLEHLRYPQDLFKVQRQKLTQYHVTDPRAFYSEGDFWRIPADPTQKTAELQPPYYLTLQMPGQEERSFSLTSTFVPAGNDRNNLVAFAAVNSDPGEDYGTIRVLQLPRSVQINGPQQVQNNFSSDSRVAETVNVLRLGDSQVRYGNLLTLPIGGGLLYVQPVYVQASAETGFPLLRKVLVSFGDKLAFEDTLDLALNSVFGGESGVGTDEPEVVVPVPGGTPPPTPVPGEVPPPAPVPADTLTAALTDIQTAYRDGQAALSRSDFAAYGEAQQRLQAAIERAIAAEDAATP